MKPTRDIMEGLVAIVYLSLGYVLGVHHQYTLSMVMLLILISSTILYVIKQLQDGEKDKDNN